MRLNRSPHNQFPDDYRSWICCTSGSLTCIPLKLSFEYSCPLTGNSEVVLGTLVCHLPRFPASWIKYPSFSTTPFLWNTDFWAMSCTTSVWFQLQPVTLSSLPSFLLSWTKCLYTMLQEKFKVNPQKLPILHKVMSIITKVIIR